MTRNAARPTRRLGLAILVVLVLATSADAYRARLAWRPVSGAAGYRLYVRQNGYPDPIAVDVGQPAPDGAGVLHYEHGGLLVESTNAFALAAYDAAQTESPRSNELAITYAAAAMIVDSDADGLTDAGEDANLNLTRDAGETDRLRADTDGDGATDGAEVTAGTDPLNAASRPGTATPTRTATPVRTATRTPTPMPTSTPTRTATPIPTSTRTSTPIPTPTATRTATPMPTATPARTTTMTPIPSVTPTPQPTATRTATPLATATPEHTATASPSATRTPVAPSPTPTTVQDANLTAPLMLSVERIE